MHPEYGVDLEQYQENRPKDPVVEAGRGLLAFDVINRAKDLPWMIQSAAGVVNLALHLNRLAGAALGAGSRVGVEAIRNGPVIQSASAGPGGGA